MNKLILTLAMVFAAEGVMAWLFYRSRALSHASWTNSDFVVFDLPVVVGFAISACVLLFKFPQMPTSKRMTAIFGLSAAGAVISSFVGTVIAFNLYGT
jgi:ribose/xylose/arabinose/galactoside ABC-type transport system permease subunit